MTKKAAKPAPRRGSRVAASEADRPTTHRPFAGLAPERTRPAREHVAVERAVKPPPQTPPRAERFADLVPHVSPLASRARRVKAGRVEVARATDDVRFEVVDDGHLVEGRRIDVDPRALGRLKRGEHACDARLDLHGRSASEARPVVESFLVRSAREGAIVVEIIHGKGKHSVSGVGILRGELGAWLSQGSAARVVVAFASVRDDAGNPGRIRVLLRRPGAD